MIPSRHLVVVALVVSFLLVTLWGAHASAEKLMIRVGSPELISTKPLFSWDGEMKVGGSVLFNFDHEGVNYKVKVTGKERTAADKDALGTYLPIFSITVYRGHTTVDAIVAEVEGVYPTTGKDTVCGVAVGRGKSNMWVMLGVSRDKSSPEMACDKQLAITKELQK